MLDSKSEINVLGSELGATHGYSQCLRSGPFVFIAGQCGTGDGWGVVSREFEPQARRALDRVKEAVEAADGTLADIVSMTVFLTDIRNGSLFNEIRLGYFSRPYPTSAIIGVASLMPDGGLIEIQATAVVSK